MRAANTPVWINADGAMDPKHIPFNPAVKQLKGREPEIRLFYVDPPMAWQGTCEHTRLCSATERTAALLVGAAARTDAAAKGTPTPLSVCCKCVLSRQKKVQK